MEKNGLAALFDLAKFVQNLVPHFLHPVRWLAWKATPRLQRSGSFFDGLSERQWVGHEDHSGDEVKVALSLLRVLSASSALLSPTSAISWQLPPA